MLQDRNVISVWLRFSHGHDRSRRSIDHQSNSHRGCVEDAGESPVHQRMQPGERRVHPTYSRRITVPGLPKAVLSQRLQKFQNALDPFSRFAFLSSRCSPVTSIRILSSLSVFPRRVARRQLNIKSKLLSYSLNDDQIDATRE